jgi:hypothetical protein
MKTYIFILLIPFLLCFSGKAISQVEQEEEVIITKPAEDSADINTFYDELSKDGEWIKVDKEQIDSDESLQLSETVDIDEDVIDDYIWRPSVAISVDWNPYTFGHWEFTRFGWVWVSDYDWGWGPYHYGRWWFSNNWGWVWSPGHRWAPSWVSWCHTRDHIGWHPISPRTNWRSKNGVIVTEPRTPKQRGITNKWTFVSKTDFQKKITKSNIVDLKANKNILASAKMNIKNNEVYNSGPNKTALEKTIGEQISKKKVTFTTVNGTRYNNSSTKTNTANKKNNQGNINSNKHQNTNKSIYNGNNKNSRSNGNSNTNRGSNTKKDYYRSSNHNGYNNTSRSGNQPNTSTRSGNHGNDNGSRSGNSNSNHDNGSRSNNNSGNSNNSGHRK